tara:strand:+ start:1771 stop:2475 length:705 start_codon:yes stop_codon:yes gene_type:complete
MKILEYSTKKYNFAELVGGLFPVDLSELDNEDQKGSLTLGKDTHTSFHRVFYDRLDSGWPEFVDLYHSFLREVIHPLFEDDVLIFQKYPGIRFNRPGAKAVYKWHSDGDEDHSHPLGEVNVFLPITRCIGNNSMWHETIPGMGDWRPLEIDYGKFLIGYLNQCRHGNKTNDTGKTRASFDFRVMPGFAYDENCPLQSCTTKQRFLVGDYYNKIERGETPSMYDPIENAGLGNAC